MSSRTDRSDPILNSLCQELDNRILIGGEPLRECYRRFEEMHSRSANRKKLSPAILIEYTAEAALAHPEPLALLLKAIEFMPVKHGPPSVIEGLLRLKRTEKRDLLLYEIAGRLDTAPSTDLMSKMASELGAAFSNLPIKVWESNRPRIGDPRWCRVWGGLSQGVVNHLTGKSVRLVREVMEQIVTVIEQVPSPGAEGLVPLALALLARETADTPGPFSQRLLNSPAGRLARTLVNSLTGSPVHTSELGREMPAVPTTPIEPVLSKTDFPMEPHKTLFQVWSSLGACLRSGKDQDQRIFGLEATNQELQTRLRTLDQETARQREELVRVQEQLERERERGVRLLSTQESLTLKSEEAAKERERVVQELHFARGAYDRLDGQTAKEKATWRDQMLTDLLMRLQQPCEETAEMLEMALTGEKDLSDVTRMWNRFDEVLARSLGRDRLHPIPRSKR